MVCEIELIPLYNEENKIEYVQIIFNNTKTPNYNKNSIHNLEQIANLGNGQLDLNTNNNSKDSSRINNYKKNSSTIDKQKSLGVPEYQTLLEKSNQKLKVIMDAIPDLLFEVDLDGTIYNYHTHNTELLAASPDNFLGKKFSDVLPENAANVCQSALYEANEKGSG